MAAHTSPSALCLGLGLKYGISLKALPSPSLSSAVALSRHVTPPAIASASFTAKVKETEQKNQRIPLRRSGNYPPPNWDFDFVQSLKNDYSGEMFVGRCNVVIGKVKAMLSEEVEPLTLLELIDDLQRLGVSYHFQDQILSILSALHKENYMTSCSILPHGKGLYATALGFRLMRQHGFFVSQEVFDGFKDEKRNFRSNLCNDIKGMLQLYEASYLQTENESTLESAREFTAKHLKDSLEEKRLTLDQEQIALLVQHALELPLHWRTPRLEARWFMDLYEKRLNKNEILLELAKLDFNIVQEMHQKDLKYSSRWWESTCLGGKLNFARDRLVENFFWTIGVIFEPEYGYCRRMSTKVNALVTTIDDIYDVYGTLDELELFTLAVERWDVKVAEDLPDYMQICYLALFNATNEMAYNAMKEHGVNIIPYLIRAWADLCKCYWREAKWYYSGYTPTLQEYLDNAWISISAPVILVHAFFFVTNSVTEEVLECLHPYHNIIRYSAMILRLSGDLGTSLEELKRGDVPKSVECYMNETGVSEAEAREYVKSLISETWKKLNKERVAANSPFPQVFIGAAVNLGRMAQCMYQYGDGHGHSNFQTKDRIRASLFQPIAVSLD